MNAPSVCAGNCFRCPPRKPLCTKSSETTGDVADTVLPMLNHTRLYLQTLPPVPKYLPLPPNTECPLTRKMKPRSAIGVGTSKRNPSGEEVLSGSPGKHVAATTVTGRVKIEDHDWQRGDTCASGGRYYAQLHHKPGSTQERNRKTLRRSTQELRLKGT